MLGWLMIDLVEAVVFHWPLWLALFLAQIATLWCGQDMGRWLPMGLMVLGFAWCFLRGVWQ